VKENGDKDVTMQDDIRSILKLKKRENVDFSNCIVFLSHPLFITKHLRMSVLNMFCFADFSTAFIYFYVYVLTTATDVLNSFFKRNHTLCQFYRVKYVYQDL
jgi:hypothetical protein